MRQITKRFSKGVDLKKAILELAKEKDISAGVIICSVGSLSKAKFRLPVIDNKPEYKELSGEMEILSINGRIAEKGSHAHLHIMIGLQDGTAVGGHLEEGCMINTTAEIVLLAFDDVRYYMVDDPETGYKELSVEKLN